jgi:prepilin-type processing-associated H-X9-DG protein
MNRKTYKGHEIQVKAHNGLRNALFIDGAFTGDAGFFSAAAALAYGERLVDERIS